VILTAAIINLITYNLIMRGSPLYASDFEVPRSTKVEGSVFFGALIFGLGLGMSGLTPGSAIVNFFVLQNVVFFMIAMAIGQLIFDEYSRRNKTMGDKI